MDILSHPHVRRQDTSYIGKPIAYSTGPYAGRTVRAELQEYQKPDLGRKCVFRCIVAPFLILYSLV